MRTRHRTAAVFATLALAVSGCSLLPGDDDPAPTTESADGQPTAWERARVRDVAPGGTLRLAISATPTTFNPAHTDASREELDRLLGPTTGNAVRFTATGAWQIDPDYASDVEVVDEDPLTVRVELNRDAVWAGGSPITADDMVAYWKAMRGSNDDYRVASSEGWDDIDEVDADGDFAYEVTFDRVRSDWPLYIYPRLAANVSGDPKRFNTGHTDTPVSSNGPFVITDIDARTGTITQKRNPRWWGATPRLKEIVWRIAAPDVQAEAFAADELDVATIEAAGYEAVDEGRVQRASGSQWTQLTMNAGRGPLRDVDVRRAVAAALDRTALSRAVAKPLGARARTADSLLVLPGQKGYDDVASPIKRDLDGARSLLEKAGYELSGGDAPKATKKGDQLTLTLPVVNGSSTVAERAKAIAQQLGEIGIAVKTTQVAADDYLDQVLVPLDFDLLTYSWGPSLVSPAAAEERFRPITSPANLTGISSPGKPWKAVRTELDPDQLVAAMAKLETSLRDDAVMVPLSVVPSAVAVRDGVVNVGATSFEQPRWTTVGFRADD